jgi:UDP-N-acetyl-D-glucosamine dehydrogenase
VTPDGAPPVDDGELDTDTAPARDGDTVVGVVGLGYVGLPLALAMGDAGYDVVGVEVDAERVDALRAGTSYVSDVGDDAVAAHVGERFQATTDYGALSRADGVSICVPTPLRKSGQPDISYIVDAADRLAAVLAPDTTVVLESTVYPGATEEVVAPALAEAGFVVGEDVFVAFSPERIDPGNEEYGTTDIPKVVGGITPACRDHALALYGPVFDELVPVDSATEAEMVKLLENTFRSVNIALINEMATIAHDLGVDIWNVVDAAATKPFGFMPFYPGPGLGGHCIPVDPQYLSWKADQQGLATRFIDLADGVNRSMPEHVVERVVALLNDAGVAVPDSDVLVLGVAYKPGVTDTRESPAKDVVSLLADWGATVEYHDPHVPELSVGEDTYRSVPLSVERLQNCDCAVVVTDHDGVDVDLVVREAPLVFDTRNATAGHDAEHVHQL